MPQGPISHKNMKGRMVNENSDLGDFDEFLDRYDGPPFFEGEFIECVEAPNLSDKVLIYKGWVYEVTAYYANIKSVQVGLGGVMKTTAPAKLFQRYTGVVPPLNWRETDWGKTMASQPLVGRENNAPGAENLDFSSDDA